MSSSFTRHSFVEVGSHETVDTLVAALEARGYEITDLVRTFVHRVIISSPQTLGIIIPTVRDLGFAEEWTSIQDIHARGIQLGYRLVPPDLAFYLRLAYLEQPMDEVVFMAMEALHSPSHGSFALSVGHAAGGKFVSCIYGNPGYRYLLGHRFAFLEP